MVFARFLTWNNLISLESFQHIKEMQNVLTIPVRLLKPNLSDQKASKKAYFLSLILKEQFEKLSNLAFKIIHLPEKLK
jgi:hypothetical protein